MDKRYDRPLTIEELAAMPDEEIDFSDIPEANEDFWHKAEVRMPSSAAERPAKIAAMQKLIDEAEASWVSSRSMDDIWQEAQTKDRDTRRAYAIEELPNEWFEALKDADYGETDPEIEKLIK